MSDKAGSASPCPHDELRRIPTVPGAYQRFYESVMLALREDAPPPVDPDGVVAGLEVLDAARKSARERRVVELR
jgi:predicted dehydrogenase